MDQDIRLIAMAINGVMAATQPISHNFLPTSFYYVYDVFETFVQRTSSKLTLTQFFHLLKKVDCVVVLEGCNAGMSIVCLRSHFNKDMGLQILRSDVRPGGDLHSNAAEDVYDSLFEDSDSVVIQAVDGKNVSPKRTGLAEEMSKRKKTHGKGEPGKSKDKAKKSDEKNAKTYKKTREQLLAAFKDGVIVPVSILHSAFIRAHGFAFEYKRLPCKSGCHAHNTLSKYIMCCKDTFEIMSFGDIYIKRVDYDAKILVERRKNMHIPKLSTPASKYHLELLLVDMFPTKVSVEYNDLNRIFKEIYNVSLSSLCNGDPKKAIASMGTPNIYFTQSKRTMVTLVPSWTSIYKSFGDSEKVLRACTLDTGILAKKNAEPEKSKEPNVQASMGKSSHYIEDILCASSSLLDIAGTNVPRHLQTQHVACDVLSLFKFCDTDGGLSLQWGFVNQCVRLSSKNTFFDIN